MDTLGVTWWLWMVVGLVLLAGEILTPGGFYLIFFGASALLVGLLKLFGFSMGLAAEGLLFAAAAVAGLIFFRRPLMQRFHRLTPQLNVDNLTTEVACAKEDIAAGAIGKVELRGTAWNAENIGETTIPKAARCRIERVDGLTLYVRTL